MSHLVTQSTHDIGVLVALGARPGNIIRLVVRQGMQLAGVGIAVGVVGAAALTRVMTSLLFGVSTTDAFTFGTVPALLAAVGFTASVIPAWRATRVIPWSRCEKNSGACPKFYSFRCVSARRAGSSARHRRSLGPAAVRRRKLR